MQKHMYTTVCGIVTKSQEVWPWTQVHRLVCVCGQSCEGVKKTCTESKERVLPQNRVHYSFSTVWRVSPYGLLGWIRWSASRLNDSLLLPLLKAILLMDFFRLQQDSKGISNGQVSPGFFFFVPTFDSPTLSLTHFPIIWYATFRLC